ncbi:MAG: hypothetical protein EOP49_35200 [Sphingobacteriales bacterium]|nr:MAG: hypothetical protein EOP49_35200 [Sphingobacteriales bacterium]
MMTTRIYKILSIALISFSVSCTKPENPVPVEQELITTLRLNIKDAAGITQTFDYKIENGFGNSNQGTIDIDTVRLLPNSTYTVITQVLNEKESPAEDITQEVISENSDHLFLYLSNPATGAGSISATGGNLDNNMLPFNQAATLTTGPAGSGKFTVYLIHAPQDKSAASPAAAGGETDVEAAFPVMIQ